MNPNFKRRFLGVNEIFFHVAFLIKFYVVFVALFTKPYYIFTLEMLNLNQSKLQDEIISFKQQHELMNNQLQELNTRLRMTGVGGLFAIKKINLL